jgi:hypothetical protein
LSNYLRIRQQTAHYQLLAEPTVTVIVKSKDSKKLQYSSWERFKEFSINSPDITSELIIKFEFLMQLPNTTSPQRCIVNVALDSGLPVVMDQDHEEQHLLMLEFISFFGINYRTVEISIDFVDFLIAKIFCGVVEDWFLTLDSAPKSNLTVFLVRRAKLIRSITGQFGRLGSAAFLSSYVWFSGGVIGDIAKLVYAISIALFMWSVVVVLTTSLDRFTAKRLTRNIVPSIILLTDADTKAFEQVKLGLSSSRNTLAAIICAAISDIGLHLIASYIYTLCTSAKP